MTRSELEELRTYLDRRFDSVDGRLDVAERQHTELVAFLGGKFDKIDARFEGVEGRLTKVEVGQEGIRHDIQLLAEGFGATKRRIDRLEALHEDELA